MHGSSFSDTVSPKVSCAIDSAASITDWTFPVLMQTYIPKIDPTTARSRVAPGLKVAKGSNGKMR